MWSKLAIKTISIQDFTIFKEMHMEFFDGINIFIGDNGTGKPHFLKILYAFCESETDDKFEKKLNKCLIPQYTGDPLHYDQNFKGRYSSASIWNYQFE
ncbi:MAG: AAA family ATPase [Methanocalculaceae archaeon]|nr:AAA family ATPase [Methanocalculaceae archaeon]